MRHYYAKAQVIIFVIDSNDRDRIDDAKCQLNVCLNEDELKDAIFLIMANKQDIPGCLSIEEIQKCLELDKIRNKKINIVGTVATTGQGLDESFEWISSQLILKDIKAPITETFNDWISIFNKLRSFFNLQSFYLKPVS